MKLKVEVNSRAINDTSRSLEGSGIMITPPVGEDFWLMRVPLSEDQAIVAFPKFGTIGIGFSKEKDWNTNLPYGCGVIEIYEHIVHNKGSAKISRGKCIEAIVLIKEAIVQMRDKEYSELLKRCAPHGCTDAVVQIGKYLRQIGRFQVAEAIGQ